MKRSWDEYRNGRLFNGYDYENQAWVLAGKYVSCGHPDKMNCGCYGKLHAEEETKIALIERLIA